MNKQILVDLDQHKEPIENAKIMVTQWIKGCKDLPEDEQIEKLALMLAVTIRDNPIPKDLSGYDAGIFMGVKNSVLEVRVHGDKETLINILLSAFEKPQIESLLSQSLMLHKLKSIADMLSDK